MSDTLTIHGVTYHLKNQTITLGDMLAMKQIAERDFKGVLYLCRRWLEDPTPAESTILEWPLTALDGLVGLSLHIVALAKAGDLKHFADLPTSGQPS